MVIDFSSLMFISGTPDARLNVLLSEVVTNKQREAKVIQQTHSPVAS